MIKRVMMVVKNAHIFIKSSGLWSGAVKKTIEKIIKKGCNARK